VSRRNDTFLGAAKAACRAGNMAAVSAERELWEPDSPKLRCDWCELMGESGLETLAALESRGVMRPGGFVGVDSDFVRISRFAKQRPDMNWVAGDLFTSVSRLSRHKIGVMNIDGYGQVGADTMWAKLSALTPIVRSGLREFGRFVLFLNKDLDSVIRHKVRPSAGLRKHVEIVCDALSGLPFAPDPYELLPKGFEDVVDGSFVGALGAFEIYRGRVRSNRMANLRLSF